MGLFLFFFAWLLGVASGLGGAFFLAVFFIKHKISLIDNLTHPNQDIHLAGPDNAESTLQENQSELTEENTVVIESEAAHELNQSLTTVLTPIPLDGPSAEKKKNKDLRVIDPLSAAIKNRRAGRASTLIPDETYRSGWLKIRGSLLVWWNRWVVLKPGKLIYYQSEKKEDCFGIVVLSECVIEQRQSDKKGFCFALCHPQKKTIYSDKGLKGETLKSAKFPGNSSECIIRAQDEAEGMLWMELIQKAIHSSQEFAMQPLGNSAENSPVVPHLQPAASQSATVIPTTEASDVRAPPPVPPKPLMHSFTATEMSTKDPPVLPERSGMKRSSSTGSFSGILKRNLTDSTFTSLTQPSSRATTDSEDEANTDTDITEDKGISRTGSHSSLVVGVTKDVEVVHLSSSASIPIRPITRTLSIPGDHTPVAKSAPSTPVKAAPTQTIIRDATVVTAPVGNTNVNVVVPTAIVELTGDYPISQSVPPPRREGWLEAKTLKGWRSFYFVLRSGLLTFFDNDKALDCIGIVDLENCQIITLGDSGFQILNVHKKSNVFIANTTDPTESGVNDVSYTTGIVLRTEEKTEPGIIIQDWVKLLEEEIPKCKRSSPLLLPRIPFFLGEKSHWFNVALTQIFQKHLQPSTALIFKFKAVLMKKFDRIKKPDYLGEINIEDIFLGDDMFHFKEVSCLRLESGELVGEADVVYNGGFHLKLSTQLHMLGVTVPVNVSVKLDHLTGRAMLYASPEVASRFTISFVELPNMKFDVQLQVGQRTRFDVHKFFSPASDFLQAMLKKLMFRNTVVPNRVTFTLPVPGKRFSVNTIQLTSRAKPQKNQSNQTNLPEVDDKASQQQQQ